MMLVLVYGHILLCDKDIIQLCIVIFVCNPGQVTSEMRKLFAIPTEVETSVDQVYEQYI